MARTAGSHLRAVLAENIRAFRKQHGYSQEQLADLCGLHRTYVGSVERLQRNVTLNTLEVLARALRISVPTLLTGNERPQLKNQDAAQPPPGTGRKQRGRR
jgi:transcriptional regulator with XRE-family HTH domain